jgi:undecaprenyl phosphate-alpha-L-ara4FN deformylase
MRVMVLKVDVDTWRGTRDGVPRLLETMTRLQVPATFLFSLGPDHTGRAIKRIFRPGFFGKVRRTSVVSNYGIGTLLYGTLLPGPRIAARCRELLREVAQRGFEVGVHCFDHVKWQDGVANASRDWTRRELQRAGEVFVDVFGAAPTVHGAAGWQVNRHVPALQQELGYRVASDTRGRAPFVPRAGGVPQLPTTLPTLDELLGRDDLGGRDAIDVLESLTRDEPPQGHVYTLHAEMEGGAYLASFERLLHTWRQQGYEFATMGTLFERLDVATLPRCDIVAGEVDGRSGALALQGAA